jgi:hypothetical protein
VVVAASADRALSGALRLSAGDEATTEPTEIPVRVDAGKTAEFPFALRLTRPPSPLAGRASVTLVATLGPDAGESTSARATFPVMDRPLTGVPLANAGDFVEESGGAAHRRDDKPNSGGKALSHWIAKGHCLSWQIHVPQVGRYHLVIRYANPWNWTAERSLLVDGQALPGAERVLFPSWSDGGGPSGDWVTLPVRLPTGSLATWNLSAGPHRITMDNTNDRWLNLDQLAFVPAP